jgi:hypothetical protein
MSFNIGKRLIKIEANVRIETAVLTLLVLACLARRANLLY